MVNLTGPPGVDNRHGQHDAVLTSTPGEPIQGNTGGDNQYPEVDCSKQMAHSIRGALIHGYCLTLYFGPLQPYERGLNPCIWKEGGTN